VALPGGGDGSVCDQLRIGAVSYLNARPLCDRLVELDAGVELHLDYPSVLASMLARGELDAAMIPSVEYLRGCAAGVDYRVVPGVAIATRGPVRSVKLLTRVPFKEIRSLALDQGSRTSQVLAQIWLAERFQVRPSRLEVLDLGASPLESRSDAVLVIGDRAMTVRDESFLNVIDLGQAWKELTGLPFVFAFWVLRSGVDQSRLVELFQRARDEGLRRVREIAADAAVRLGFDPDYCHEYLTRNLSYDLNASEIAGFRLFAEKAAALGLAPEGVRLVFAEDQLHPATRD